jgi:hypothetical protein
MNDAQVPVVNMRYCEYNKAKRRLTLASEYCGMPGSLIVESHHTGRQILFRPIGVNHPDFDQDGWDGEQQIYEPVEPVAHVRTLVIYNAW